MPDRNQNGHYSENHRLAAELHDAAAHAHKAAEHGDRSDHLTGHEQSRRALEHSREAHDFTQAITVGHGIRAFGHDEIAALAHALWQARGCPEGSPETDWFHAAEQLRSRGPEA